jgi:opacity protein-like surface antigen
MGEIILGIGVHYQITENIDAQIAYNRTGIIVDNFHDEDTDDVSSLCQNNIMLGFNYKF